MKATHREVKATGSTASLEVTIGQEGESVVVSVELDPFGRSTRGYSADNATQEAIDTAITHAADYTRDCVRRVTERLPPNSYPLDPADLARSAKSLPTTSGVAHVSHDVTALIPIQGENHPDRVPHPLLRFIEATNPKRGWIYTGALHADPAASEDQLREATNATTLAITSRNGPIAQVKAFYLG